MLAARRSRFRGILGWRHARRSSFASARLFKPMVRGLYPTVAPHQPPDVNSATLPPAAVVLMVTVCSEQKRTK